jgi:signal transduction histidine kinase
MTLAEFIRSNTEAILAEWETFARSLPTGDTMDIAALRDHAKAMLGVIAVDLESPQTSRQQADKAAGKSDAGGRSAPTAAQEHGAGRAESGFTVEDMVAEFRALRASVVRLWAKQAAGGRGGATNVRAADLEDLTRFNEAIDQAIAESITRFTEQIGQSKERFLAILGHDLRTPIGAIITSSTFMLEKGGIPEPNLKLVKGIATSARRMNQMVSDLLDFARTRFGDSIPIVRAPMDLSLMIQGIASEIRASHPGSSVHVETSGDLLGNWDVERLTQALTNLVANAVQHGATGQLINIVARGEPDEVIITVQNRGPVIPQDQFGAIFEAMRHGTVDGARDRRHLGLGLYIVEKIVTAHNGKVEVTSTEESGTTFSVRLPRA